MILVNETINKIKRLKLEAMKENTPESRLKRDAYNEVITSIQYKVGKQEQLTDSLVIGCIKAEIKKYTEYQSNSQQVLLEAKQKANALEELLPKQLTREELISAIENLEDKYFALNEKVTPKYLMEALDAEGYVGRYSKAMAAELAKTIK